MTTFAIASITPSAVHGEGSVNHSTAFKGRWADHADAARHLGVSQPMLRYRLNTMARS